MPQNTIILEKYMKEMSALYSFYSYSERALNDPSTLDGIIKEEICNISDYVNTEGHRFLKEPQSCTKITDVLEGAMPREVLQNISGGLSVLRGLLLVGVHSIFEQFLCHTVEIYLFSFPQILKGVDKTLKFREVVENVGKVGAFDICVKKEVESFSYLSLKNKKKYLEGKMKLDDKQIWKRGGKELWQDVDEKRHDIVHKEKAPKISADYLLESINYFQGSMIAIAASSQAFHGIPMKWSGLETAIKVGPNKL